MKLFSIKISPNILPLGLFFLFYIASLFLMQKASVITGNTHFILQANSFLHGRLDIPNPPSWLNDLAFFHNKYYVPFGPIPAVFLMPIVAILGTGISQQILNILALPLLFVILFGLAKRIGMKRHDALWMGLFFIFGTLFISLLVINISAFLVQVITTLFLLLALFEYFGKKRFFLIGTLLGLGILTRDIIVFAALFFIEEIIFSRTINNKLKSLFLFALPLIVSMIVLSGFNYARFGSFIENGYNYNISNGQDLLYAKQKGFFSLAHVPGNLYLFLFKGPDPIKENPISYVLQFPYIKIDPWGLGILFTSPLFLYLLFINIKKGYVLSSLATVVVMLIPTLSYYAYGAWQYGYRHAVDFYPFLFILLISIFHDRLPNRAKLLILYGMVFNFYFMLSLWGIYPF